MPQAKTSAPKKTAVKKNASKPAAKAPGKAVVKAAAKAVVKGNAQTAAKADAIKGGATKAGATKAGAAKVAPAPAARTATKAGKGLIRAGIGGWTFEPWRGVFYPADLSQKRELEYASRRLTSIEINGTYYSTFKPTSWSKWREETPDGFVFSVKASRYCTNRRVLSEAKESIDRFIGQGLSMLGDRLGPINWQFMGTKKFDPEDFGKFLALLPKEVDGLPLRHALEVRSPTFKDPRFYDLARKHNAAIVFADDDDFPEIDEPTANFTYARLMRTQEDIETGYAPGDLDRWVKRARDWAKRGDVFVYFISGAKVRAPSAAVSFIDRL